MSTYTFKTMNEALPAVLGHILRDGEETGSRNGRVKELLNPQIVLTHPQCREVLCLNRKANVFAQIAETMWVLAGRNDIEWLSAYLPRAKDYSDDGATWRGGYGPRIRGDKDHPVDQLAHVIDTLRADPLSRRAVISIYDPARDIPAGKDVPCNDFLQFQSRLGYLHLTVTVRSNDAMWGWSGINAFEWSTLQEIVAHVLGINVGTLTFNVGNLHLYEPHWDKARRIEEDLGLKPNIVPFKMPDHMDKTLEWVDILIDRWFTWEDMCRRGDDAPSLVEDFEEPLFRSWAAAIGYFWSRDDGYLPYFASTALGLAVARTPRSVLSEPPQTSREVAAAPGHPLHLHERTRAFYDFVTDLHAKKHASYGDSWKKRGEMLSILPNMARKVDRLGVGDEYDSSADTLIDLLVYSIKYGCLLAGDDDGPAGVNKMLAHFLAEVESFDTKGVIAIPLADIVTDFNRFCDDFVKRSGEPGVIPVGHRRRFAENLAHRVAPYARDVWWSEQQDKPGGANNPLCGKCGSAKSNHGPGGSRSYCTFKINNDYQGADAD